MAGSVGSWFMVSVVLVILSSSSTVTGYAISREAIVELLPNDLTDVVSVRPDPDPKMEPNKTISTPQEVIRNQIMKIAQSMHYALEGTRRNLRLRNNGKRDLGNGNYLPYLLPLMACFVKLVNSGTMPESFLKGLVPLEGGSSGGLLSSKNQPLCSLVQGRRQDPVSKALGQIPAAGVVTDLAGTLSHSALPTGLVKSVPSTGIVALPGTGAVGMPSAATGLAAGAVAGVAMAGAAEIVRDTAPGVEPVLRNIPLTGGKIETVPLAAIRPLAKQSDAVSAFQAGYNTGVVVGSVFAKI